MTQKSAYPVQDASGRYPVKLVDITNIVDDLHNGAFPIAEPAELDTGHSYIDVSNPDVPLLKVYDGTQWRSIPLASGAGSGLDADTLRGAAPDTAGTANTIAQRNSAGWVTGTALAVAGSGTGTATEQFANLDIDAHGETLTNILTKTLGDEQVLYLVGQLLAKDYFWKTYKTLYPMVHGDREYTESTEFSLFTLDESAVTVSFSSSSNAVKHVAVPWRIGKSPDLTIRDLYTYVGNVHVRSASGNAGPAITRVDIDADSEFMHFAISVVGASWTMTIKCNGLGFGVVNQLATV